MIKDLEEILKIIHKIRDIDFDDDFGAYSDLNMYLDNIVNMIKGKDNDKNNK